MLRVLRALKLVPPHREQQTKANALVCEDTRSPHPPAFTCAAQIPAAFVDRLLCFSI